MHSPDQYGPCNNENDAYTMVFVGQNGAEKVTDEDYREDINVDKDGKFQLTFDQPGTYVLMKSGKKMNQVKEILAKSGRNIRMVENCGMPDEHIYNSVEEIPDDAGYYSLIIAKEQDGGL